MIKTDSTAMALEGLFEEVKKGNEGQSVAFRRKGNDGLQLDYS